MPRTDRFRSNAGAATAFPWRLFWLLLVAAIGGIAAVLPYALALFQAYLRPLPSLPALIAGQLLQGTLFFGVIVGCGLLLARRVGIPVPLLSRWLYGDATPVNSDFVGAALLAGILVGAFVVVAVGFVLLPLAPDWPLSAEAAVPIWKRILACFYGAVNEELLMRLFLLSLLLWAIGKVKGTIAFGTATFWIVNVITALAFGAGHLPVAGFVMKLTVVSAAAIVTLNGVAGLVFGWLTWRRGLEAAMIAHFVADLVMHLLGPAFAKA